MFFFKTPIQKQIDEFVFYRRSNGNVLAPQEQMWLNRFMYVTDIKNISEIKDLHIAIFRRHIAEESMSQYAEHTALRSIRGMLRYYNQKGYPCPKATIANMTSFAT